MSGINKCAFRVNGALSAFLMLFAPGTVVMRIYGGLVMRIWILILVLYDLCLQILPPEENNHGFAWIKSRMKEESSGIENQKKEEQLLMMRAMGALRICQIERGGPHLFI